MAALGTANAVPAAGASPAAAEDPAPVAAYLSHVLPFLQKNCLACHSPRAQTGNLSLHFPGPAAAVAPSALPVWERVLDKLATGRMPPLGSPRPAPGDIAQVTAWIERLPGRSPSVSEPGRVTSRRLNRAEYNNTVRDLLGVTLRPADEFPLDDAGYGFDTIGDVLSVSPMLMEKYIAAARRLSRVAVYGEAAPSRPTKLIRYMSKKSQDDPTPGALPFSLRGAIYGSFQFPVTAEYEFRMRVGNYRPRTPRNDRHRDLMRRKSLSESEKQELLEHSRLAFPPVRMVMTLDGAPILTEVVEGNIDYQYAHGESIARVKIQAGEHSFRASFPEFAALDNPLDNMNLDGRRKLFIDYVDIVGPFLPPPTPSSPSPAASAGGNASRNPVIFTCLERTPQCAARILGSLTRRAYRRPVAPEELQGLTGLAASVRSQGDSFEEGISVALQAILLSPNFLFRAEPVAAAPQPISSHDLASRLSYFLWSSLPDEPLMRLADSGQLRQPAVLASEVRRMIADPKSGALVENFAGQWLGLRLLDRRKPDPATFPRVDDELLEAMRQETLLFTRAILREDRGILDFLHGRFSFVNGPLARHYGIAGVHGENFERVELAGGRRAGVLMHGSILTLSSYATRTSPVLRGRWVLENILGTPPPPAPPGVPALPESQAGAAPVASLRARLEQHRANPSCATCHDQMDPIGFGLENFDASGAWRDREGQFPVDSSGVFPGGAGFAGPEQLRRELGAQSALFVRNFVEKLMTYALGRGLEIADRPVIDQIASRLAAGGSSSGGSGAYRLSALISEIVNSRPFQMRGTLPPPAVALINKGGPLAATTTRRPHHRH